MNSTGIDESSIYSWLLDKINMYLRGEYDIDYDTLRAELRNALHSEYIGPTAYASLSYHLQRKGG